MEVGSTPRFYLQPAPQHPPPSTPHLPRTAAQPRGPTTTHAPPPPQGGGRLPWQDLVPPQSLPEGTSPARSGHPSPSPHRQQPRAPPTPCQPLPDFHLLQQLSPPLPSPFVSLLSSPSLNHLPLPSLPQQHQPQPPRQHPRPPSAPSSPPQTPCPPPSWPQPPPPNLLLAATPAAAPRTCWGDAHGTGTCGHGGGGDGDGDPSSPPQRVRLAAESATAPRRLRQRHVCSRVCVRWVCTDGGGCTAEAAGAFSPHPTAPPLPAHPSPHPLQGWGRIGPVPPPQRGQGRWLPGAAAEIDPPAPSVSLPTQSCPAAAPESSGVSLPPPALCEEGLAPPFQHKGPTRQRWDPAPSPRPHRCPSYPRIHPGAHPKLLPHPCTPQRLGDPPHPAPTWVPPWGVPPPPHHPALPTPRRGQPRCWRDTKTPTVQILPPPPPLPRQQITPQERNNPWEGWAGGGGCEGGGARGGRRQKDGGR